MRPRSGLFLVRKYMRPAKIGRIIVPEAWRQDNSRALWEAVERADLTETIGIVVEPDWIVVTAPHRGVFVDKIDGVEVYALSKAEVVQVIVWSEEGEAHMVRSEDRVLVEPTKEESKFWRVERRPRQGIVRWVGADVREGIFRGDLVAFDEFAGLTVEENGEKLLLLREEEVLCRLES